MDAYLMDFEFNGHKMQINTDDEITNGKKLNILQ